VTIHLHTILNNESPVYSRGGRIVRGEGANQPGGQTSQRANKPGGERTRGRISQAQKANQPGCEQVWGRTSQGANRQRGEKARHRWNIRRSEHPLFTIVLHMTHSDQRSERCVKTYNYRFDFAGSHSNRKNKAAHNAETSRGKSNQIYTTYRIRTKTTHR